MHIHVRPVRPEDDADLGALYDALDADDRHARFFSSYHPDSSFFNAMASVGEHGGARLVAVVESEAMTERIIGEAGYSVLPNGNGEFGMAVARDWRGWLGPYLLDTLIEVAAAAGVPNLEADVLALNRSMQSLLRSRGAVVMEHDGWRVMRLVVGTSGGVPSWTGPHDRPRVLVEAPGGRWRPEDDARAAGFDVHMCPGPSDLHPDCPVLMGNSCPLAADADVIVVSRPPDDERWHELVAAHAEVHRGVPVCVDADVGDIVEAVAQAAPKMETR